MAGAETIAAAISAQRPVQPTTAERRSERQHTVLPTSVDVLRRPQADGIDGDQQSPALVGRIYLGVV